MFSESMADYRLRQSGRNEQCETGIEKPAVVGIMPRKRKCGIARHHMAVLVARVFFARRATWRRTEPSIYLQHIENKNKYS
jgi:hypothetical protein